MSLPIYITTSNLYHHILPIFFKQYNKFWGDPFTLVGYKEPPNLPDNCTFHSMGKQRGAHFFSDDLFEFFRTQPQYFVWMMEDSFVTGFDRGGFNSLVKITDGNEYSKIGRINLTTEGMKREHWISFGHYFSHPKSMYRLSTQPSIWNRNFLLYYMKPGLNPWKFELQLTDDDYMIIGPLKNVVSHNEGVRKHDIHNLNLEGIE